MPTFQERGFSERGKKKANKYRAEGVEMGSNHRTHTEDALETTDLSWDGISHLKMQNTPNVKPHKHTSHPSIGCFVDES